MANIVREIEQPEQIIWAMSGAGLQHNTEAIVAIHGLQQPRPFHLKACNISGVTLLHTIQPGDGKPLPYGITMPNGLHMPQRAAFDKIVRIIANGSVQLYDITAEELAQYGIAVT